LGTGQLLAILRYPLCSNAIIDLSNLDPPPAVLRDSGRCLSHSCRQYAEQRIPRDITIWYMVLEPMENEYRPIFEQIYQGYSLYGLGLPFSPEESLRRLRVEIDLIAEREGLAKKLRADAKVFLLVNLHEMFIRPVSMRRDQDRAQRFADVWAVLQSDLTEILHKSDADPEITARHVLDAVSSIYRELKLPSFEVWG
jgi:hypothetical protein